MADGAGTVMRRATVPSLKAAMRREPASVRQLRPAHGRPFGLGGSAAT